MLEIRCLRSLVAIAEAGQLKAAAKQIHLTPSALSHQIRVIESHYNVKIILHTKEGVNFTDAGRRLVKFAYEMMEQFIELEKDLMDYRNE